MNDPFFNGMWMRRSESSRSIATKIDDFFRNFDPAMSIEWTYLDQVKIDRNLAPGNWPHDNIAEQTRIIESCVLYDDAGELWDTRGFMIYLSGKYHDLQLEFDVHAGAKTLLETMPRHWASVSVDGDSDSDPVAQADRMMKAFIETFDPLRVVMSNTKLAWTRPRRGAWQVSAGYAVWVHRGLSDRVVGTGEVTVSEFANGYWLTAPQGVSERELARIMTEFYDRNGLTELPHPETYIGLDDEWTYTLGDGTVIGERLDQQ